MALDRTSGFDMLVQISETELNNQLATAFLAGGTFPPAISAPINAGGVTGTADLNFNTPVADLDRPRPQMGLTIPFANSQLRITAPLALTIAPLYKSRWRVELFFNWIKQHLRVKAFYGFSENAVKTQVWIAIATYLLLAILKKRLGLEASLYKLLQVLSITVLEKTPVL